MKGNFVFTQEEAAKIEELIQLKCKADASKQKGIRQKIRNLGFYASDFGITDGYTVADFRRVTRIENTSVGKSRQTKEKVEDNNQDSSTDILLNFGDNAVQTLKNIGFQGFLSINHLQDHLSLIPKEKGVYIIYCDELVPHFLPKGSGGFFKQKDPNVSLDILLNNWVENTPILYIGKAGANTSNATLQSRLKQYFDFGRGKAVGHYGGRYIWQLANPSELKVCWMVTTEYEPRTVEYALIQQFVAQFGKRPFANLKD